MFCFQHANDLIHLDPVLYACRKTHHYQVITRTFEELHFQCWSKGHHGGNGDEQEQRMTLTYYVNYFPSGAPMTEWLTYGWLHSWKVSEPGFKFKSCICRVYALNHEIISNTNCHK